MLPWLREHTEKHKEVWILHRLREYISPSGPGGHIVPLELWTVTWKTYVARWLGQVRLHGSLHTLTHAHTCAGACVHTETATETFLCGWIFDNSHLILLEYLKWSPNDFLMFPPRVGKEWMQASEAHWLSQLSQSEGLRWGSEDWKGRKTIRQNYNRTPARRLKQLYSSLVCFYIILSTSRNHGQFLDQRQSHQVK